MRLCDGCAGDDEDRDEHLLPGEEQAPDNQVIVEADEDHVKGAIKDMVEARDLSSVTTFEVVGDVLSMLKERFGTMQDEQVGRARNIIVATVRQKLADEEKRNQKAAHSTSMLPCGHQGCNRYQGCRTCSKKEEKKKRKASEAADAEQVTKLLKSAQSESLKLSLQAWLARIH